MSRASTTQRVVDITAPALLQSEQFCTELSELAQTLEMSDAAAREEANHCIEELAIEPRDRYLKWSARLARFMTSRSYQPELDVDRETLARLQALAEDRPLVFLWSHKSHLDSFVFLRAIYDSEFRPQPLSFAGINMSFTGFGTFARKAGAIFLRRSFKGADIYKLVFRHYVRYLIAKRAPLSWSIEGTRSRTGKLMPPKPGLIQWVLEAIETNHDDGVLFVPVSITFDQIAEMDDYIAINRGQPKRKESLGWFLGYIFGMQESVGKIHVRFGEPVSPQDEGEVPRALLHTSTDEKQTQTLRLALEVSRRIEHVTMVTPHSLVSLALLVDENNPCSGQLLRQRLARLLEQIEYTDLPRENKLPAQLERELDTVLSNLAGSGLIEQLTTGTWQISGDRALGASYYRNTISHYLLYAAMGELALEEIARTTDAITEPRTALETAVLRWRKLLKFEFVLRSRQESSESALAHLDRLYPGWEQRVKNSEAAFGEQTPLYARGILQSMLCAYMGSLECLEQLPPGTEDSEIPRWCLQQMEMSGRPDISSARSLPLIENFMRLLHHDKLWSKEHGFSSKAAHLREQLRLAQSIFNQHQ